MDKKVNKIYFIIAGFMFFVTIFLLVALIATGVFQQDKIIFEGYNLTLSGRQHAFNQTSPYTLLLMIGSFLAVGFYLLFEAIGKTKLSQLFFGLVFVSLGLFFIILIKLSNVPAVIIATLFVAGGLILFCRSARDLMFSKK